MKWLPVIVLTAATTAATAIAQDEIPTAASPPCEHGTAEAYLDANDVRAMIPNTGGLFWRGGRNTYEVPNGGGVDAIFTAGIWIGGMVDGELRLAATRYGYWEFWPGPVGSSPEECLKYDRIFEVREADLNIWHETGNPTQDMIEWPWQLGAPVTDGDGIPGNYNLAGGDHPELLGDQTLWWIMNDAGGEHRSTETAPLGVEVTTTAFASSYSSLLDRTTFYKYAIRFEGETTLKDAYLSFYVDSDLGWAGDDFGGSDSTLGMAYQYNADNDDNDAYGTAPPAIGFVFVDAPVVYRPGFSDGQFDPRMSSFMTSFLHFIGGGGNVQDDPNSSSEYYNYMRGRWGGTGEYLTEGGTGLRSSDKRTKFAYSGEPGEYWSELNTDGNGTSNIPADRRWVMSNGPFELQPGETTEFTVAIVWSRGSDNLDSVRQLKKDAAIIKQVAPILLKPIYSFDPELPPEPDYLLGANDIYPNPATDQASLEYSLPQPMRVRIEVFDVLGRRVHDSGDEVRGPGEYIARFDTSGWPAGVYTARLMLDHLTASNTLSVVK